MAHPFLQCSSSALLTVLQHHSSQWLPKRFLAIPRLGTLNIHPSLLPRWRGASPVQRTLEAGDKKSGVSVLWTVSKMDAGPIAAQYECDLVGDEKAPEFLTDMFAVGTLRIKIFPLVNKIFVSLRR